MAALKKLVKGQGPTLLDTDTGNKLIDLVNAQAGMTVSPAGFGKMQAGPDRAILDLSGLNSIITQLQQTVAAIQQSNNAGSDVAALAKKVNSLITAISGSTITVKCNVDGTITITQTFPGLPSAS